MNESNDIYKQKYLKYKQKYLNLKQSGGMTTNAIGGSSEDILFILVGAGQGYSMCGCSQYLPHSPTEQPENSHIFVMDGMAEDSSVESTNNITAKLESLNENNKFFNFNSNNFEELFDMFFEHIIGKYNKIIIISYTAEATKEQFDASIGLPRPDNVVFISNGNSMRKIPLNELINLSQIEVDQLNDFKTRSYEFSYEWNLISNDEIIILVDKYLIFLLEFNEFTKTSISNVALKQILNELIISINSTNQNLRMVINYFSRDLSKIKHQETITMILDLRDRLPNFEQYKERLEEIMTIPLQQ